MNRTEALSHLVHRHLVRWIHTRRVSMASIAIQTRESWERRYPDDHSVEWSQDRDAAHRAEMDAQRLARMLPGGPTRMTVDLLPCFRDALPVDVRRDFDIDLSSHFGVVFATVSVGQPTPLDLASLMRESGEAIQSVATAIADGRMDAREAAQSLRELEQLSATAAGLIATLKTLAASAGEGVSDSAPSAGAGRRHN
jgi:hypothetical protein